MIDSDFGHSKNCKSLSEISVTSFTTGLKSPSHGEGNPSDLIRVIYHVTTPKFGASINNYQLNLPFSGTSINALDNPGRSTEVFSKILHGSE